MILSRDRILATHVGSLPRSETLSEMLIDREEGKPLDERQLADEMDRAVRHVIAKQAEAGIDIGNDGEQQRVGFQTYVPRRMSGFAGESKRRRGKDFEEFPALVQDLMRRFPKRSRMQNAPEAQAELNYLGSSAITQEIDRFQGAAKAAGAFAEVFMTAPSPGIVSTTMLNAYYDSQQSYLTALAREMRNEYLAIHRSGLVLQIDAPDLAMDRSMFYRDLSDSAFVTAAEMHVEALNQAITGIPRDGVRLHCCWGNWNGPHLYDVALDLILPVLYQANVGALSIEFGNPRHQHEFEALRRHKLPDHMLLLPGVIESNSNIVEHPEVVARRLEEAVAVVGDRERVIASADCGFGTFTNREYVIEPVVWLKLKALRKGADIASSRLWGRSAAQ
jgi:5-methyltetrahydropteroyltriglutamate--homocysteine methyltransferase